MEIILHKKFIKDFARLRLKEKRKFIERKNLFQQQPYHPSLNNHSVEAAYPGWRSINITGDVRALYEHKDREIIVFMKIGTHSQLYE